MEIAASPVGSPRDDEIAFRDFRQNRGCSFSLRPFGLDSDMQPSSSQPLAGKTALVTGASAGIGEAIARSLSAAGATLALWARREERLAAISKTLHGKSTFYPVDVRNPSQIEQAVAAIESDVGPVDILVNNAGLGRGLGPVYEQSVDDINEMVDTNIKGLLFVARAVVPSMKARGSGHVVNIGSVAGRDVYAGGVVYCATKHAVFAINRGLRIDLHGSGVRVSTIDPGMVETDFSLVRFRGDADRAGAVYENTTPLTAADIADAVLYTVTAPSSVNISDVVVYPTDQASVHLIKRSPAK